MSTTCGSVLTDVQVMVWLLLRSQVPSLDGEVIVIA